VRPESLSALAALAIACSPLGPTTARAIKASDDVGLIDAEAGQAGEVHSRALPRSPERLTPSSPDRDVLGLLVDARFVYVAYRGHPGLVKVPLGGGPPILLQPDDDAPVTSFASDASYLYFTSGRRVDIDPIGVPIERGSGRPGHFEGVVLRVAKGAEERGEEIASGRFKPEDIAVDATHVYWIDAGKDEALVRQPKGRIDSEAVIAHGEFLPGSLVVSEGFAFWIDTAAGRGVMRVSTQGGGPRMFVFGAGAVAHPVRLAAVDGALYVADAGSIEGSGSIVRIGADGAIATIADHLHTPRDVAVRAGWVYWVDKGTRAKNFEDGTVEKAPAFGGDKVALASGLTAPDHLALSDTRVAWSEHGGSIKDMAR
jgi:hypothetical protein